MENAYKALPPDIQALIRGITKSVSLPDNQDSYEMIAEIWNEKLSVFEEQASGRGMLEKNTFEISEIQGAIILTHSDSLLLINPIDPEADEYRTIMYYSIGLQKTAPERIQNFESRLAEDIQLDKPIQFEAGPVQSMSPVLRIAVSDKTDPDEQEEQLSETVASLINKMIEINSRLAFESDQEAGAPPIEESATDDTGMDPS